MTKKDVLQRLCTLTTEIGGKVFNEEYPHDCFCVENPFVTNSYFQFEEKIIEYIENAVREKMN